MARKKNAFYAQSGGVTAVINASACGVIETARKHKDRIGKVFAGRNGILGALQEDLIDTSKESAAAIARPPARPRPVPSAPARYKLKKFAGPGKREYERLIEVFKAHDIGYFFYNGGGDSADTCLQGEPSWPKPHRLPPAGHPCARRPWTTTCRMTDCCPGFGSVAKYVAVSTPGSRLSTCASMAQDVNQGLHPGGHGPPCRLDRRRRWPRVRKGRGFPANHPVPGDRPSTRRSSCARVEGMRGTSTGIAPWSSRRAVKNAERPVPGRRRAPGTPSAMPSSGGVGPVVAEIDQGCKLGYKYHWAVADYLQRAARHIASKTDVKQAYDLGKKAVELAVKGHNSVMPTIVRLSDTPYKYKLGFAELKDVANVEKFMPRDFISKDGFGITNKCRNYLTGLIQGEDYPKYEGGLPVYVTMKNATVAKKLPEFKL
jgi:hypothetical protein